MIFGGFLFQFGVIQLPLFELSDFAMILVIAVVNSVFLCSSPLLGVVLPLAVVVQDAMLEPLSRMPSKFSS